MNIPPEIAHAQGHHGIKGASHGIKGGRPRLQLTDEQRKERKRKQQEAFRRKKGIQPKESRRSKEDDRYFKIWGKMPGEPLTSEEFAKCEPLWNAEVHQRQEAEKDNQLVMEESLDERRMHIEQYERTIERKPYRAPATIGRNDPCSCGSGKDR